MAITSICSGCGRTLAVADEFAGRQARCPECGQVYTVPPAGAIGAAGAPSAAGPLLSETVRFEKSSPIESGNAPPADAFGPIDLGSPLNQPMGSGFDRSLGSTSSHNLGGSSAPLQGSQYWMQATDGQVYGPADQATLARWFSEGRVGPNYQIRVGEYGTWQPATGFQPQGAQPAANPFAAQPQLTGSVGGSRRYPKADQSGLVLAMGILTWLGLCPIFGVIAWVVGAQSLRDMQQGTADPSTRGLVQVGYYLGMINVVLWICCTGLSFLGLAISMIA